MKRWLIIICVFFISFITHASPLPADQVFKINTQLQNANAFTIQWNVKPGYFIYKDRITLTESTDSNFDIGTLHFPKALIKTDKQGQSYSIYRNQLQLTIPVLGTRPGETLIDIHFQGCSDEGFCYPPEVRQIKLSINNELALATVNLETIANIPLIKTETPKENIAHALTDHHWLITLLLFFGFGLLLSFTPCILPMVPVLSGIIVGHGKDITTRKAFFLSLSYVLSMSATYAFVGAGVALLGDNLQITMQSPWAISLFSLTFVLLSLSMFGFYELRLPNTWQTKLAGLTRSQGGGHYLSAAVMGSLSTLILSPCVTAPLIGVLGYIANTGNVLFGSVTLFFVGLGMGTPLLLIGTQAGRWLPSAGRWMEMIKTLFGLMLLAVAIFLMTRILPASIIMILWAALLIFSGIYYGALTRSKSSKEKLQQGVGIILSMYGILILVGAGMGQTNPLHPLALFENNQVNQISPQVIIRSASELQLAINQAKGKPILVDFYADWCTSCGVMEATTFKDPILQKALKQYFLVKADVTANAQQEKNLLKQYGIIAPPTFLFFDTRGQPMPESTLVGEISAKVFLEHLEALSKPKS